MPENQQSKRIQQIERNPFYYKKFVVLLIVLVLALAVALFRAQKNKLSVIGVARCDPYDWSIAGAYILLMLVLPVYAKRIVFGEQELKREIGWDLGGKEVIYEKRTFIGTTALASVTGLVSTVIGIGAGITMSPYFLKIGYTPIVSSWTINLSTFLSKVAAVVINFTSGDILVSYALMYGGIISAGIIISENSILIIVKKYNSQLFYPVAYLLIVSISICFIVFVAVNKAISDTQKNVGLFNFGSYC